MSLATRYPHEEESTGLALWRATNRWQAAQRAALEPFGLTHMQFVLLAALAHLPTDEPLTQRALATYIRADVMMTSQVLRTLETLEWVERRAHPFDGRARSVVITPQGLSKVNQAILAVEDVDDAFFGPLGADKNILTALLQTLTPE
ncbi:MAG: MarR family transcriptional regulator [Propionibacteriaceae bacterium]|jgi:DNA-binding MarR family transcriptional regulator|nr:MarR family transcriptional regulator [Propionibacteriaceae bacterium]